MKRWIIRLGVVAALCAGAVLAFRLSPIGVAVREAHENVDHFTALGSPEYERLIDIATVIEAEERVGPRRSFGGIGEPPVPPNFASFGFERLVISDGMVEGRLYWLVDSGAFVRIQVDSHPIRITLVRGDYGDIVDEIYTKPESNKSVQTIRASFAVPLV